MEGTTSMNQTASISQTTALTGDTKSQMDALESRVAVLESQVTELKKTAATTVKMQGTTAAKTMASTTATTTTTAAPTTTVPPEKITIPLNVETKRGDGTLTFTKLEIMSGRKAFIFYFAIESDEKLGIMPEPKSTFLIGKSGRKYEASSMGGNNKNGAIAFIGADRECVDLSDLPTVTLTYAFKGFDPVTVTFDIPEV